LSEAPDGEGLGLLAMVAGWKGEKTSRAFFQFPPKTDVDKKIAQLQLIAVEALGASRSPLAIEPLKDFLYKSKTLQGAAARALAVNGTVEARAVLEEGIAGKKRVIRELCELARRDQLEKKR
jgi:HEAT repeat protein